MATAFTPVGRSHSTTWGNYLKLTYGASVIGPAAQTGTVVGMDSSGQYVLVSLTGQPGVTVYWRLADVQLGSSYNGFSTFNNLVMTPSGGGPSITL